MKIGILSDTHSYWDERYATHFAGYDEIWHAGDVGDESIIERLEQICPVVRGVSGNVDHGMVRKLWPEVQEFEIDGIKVFITHIGGYPGRYSQGLKKLLKEERINLFISGHSHILKIMPDNELGLLHINPGAAGVQGWQTKRTLVKMDITEGKIENLEVVELGKRRKEEGKSG